MLCTKEFIELSLRFFKILLRACRVWRATSGAAKTCAYSNERLDVVSPQTSQHSEGLKAQKIHANMHISRHATCVSGFKEHMERASGRSLSRTSMIKLHPLLSQDPRLCQSGHPNHVGTA